LSWSLLKKYLSKDAKVEDLIDAGKVGLDSTGSRAAEVADINSLISSVHIEPGAHQRCGPRQAFNMRD
jgi:hypothetical protein